MPLFTDIEPAPDWIGVVYEPGNKLRLITNLVADIWFRGVISVVIFVLCQESGNKLEKKTLTPTIFFILVDILCENPLGTNNGLTVGTKIHFYKFH